MFGPDTAVFFVATGTAANTLAIRSLTEPWEQVLCHRFSHYACHESTAPERLVGCRTRALETTGSKLAPGDLASLSGFEPGDVHEPQPGVLTLTNATEFGTIYRPDEMKELCDAAHRAGFRVHVDGARFANAVAAAGGDARALSVDAGVDALSFGGTKNGLAFGEAVLFFPANDRDGRTHRAIESFPYHRKGTGHLLSKHRFVSAPFEATLRDDAWLRHAAHANAMAARLGAGLEALGIAPAHPVETNGVFVRLPDAVDRALRVAGYGYYPFGDPGDGLSRLLCSFDTRADEVDAFLAVAASA